ncbi:APC family permease [Anaerovorax odorimutans]|uniref:APC family permease n=1 Tax=Anaerovorax odorimutans TaxID=109327 RepID=A0ABT1RP82_9FIRM|nr:APC family permease [Anaerovorax odorimutans]MCQ4637008.1 APC family permease [Anaerovorax odorimutans]
MSKKNEGVGALKKHKVGLTSVVALLYCACAGGAFGIEEMITESGPGVSILMLIIIPFVWSIPVCLGVAELGAILPGEGGPFVWIKEAFGEFWSFLSTFLFGISFYVGNAVFVVLSVGYLSYIVELTALQATLIKIFFVILFTIINIMGVKEVGKVSIILTVLVIAAFALVTIVGFANWKQNPLTPVIPEDAGVLESVSGCAAICIWMYTGYLSIPSLAGEIENPQLIPKATIISLPLVSLTYILPTIAGLASVGNWQNWTTDGATGGVGYSTVLTQNIGPYMGLFFCIVAIASNLAIFNSQIAAGSRGFFVLSDANLFPRFMNKVSRKKGVPYICIIVYSAVTLFLLKYDFTALVLLEVAFSLGTYALVAMSLLRIRKKIPLSQRDPALFKVPGGQFGLKYCGCAPVAVAAVIMLINGTDYFLGGIMLVPAAVICYILFKRFYGGFYKDDPALYPINPRTGLAVGDIVRIGVFCLFVGIYSMAAVPFLRWYEGDWGPEYYAEEYGTGFLSSFDSMLNMLLIYGIIMTVIGAVIFFIGRKKDDPKGGISFYETQSKQNTAL